MKNRCLGCALLALSSFTAFGGLRFGEVCPRPLTNDVNGCETGWVELVNDGDAAVNLSDYSFGRFNLGKKFESKKAQGLLGQVVPAGGRVVFHTSEDYGYETTTLTNGMMVVPLKVNPKKFPMLVLCKGGEEVDRLPIPVDIADGYSFAVTNAADTSHSSYAILPSPTPGTADDLTGAIAYGPNVGPLPLVKDAAYFTATAYAKTTEDYAVSFPVNPITSCDGDAIANVTLEYRIGTGATNAVAMTKGEKNKTQGQLWTAAIPASALADAAPGEVVRWRAKITDAAGLVWTSPSFCNPDDGFAWFGTIVEPGDLVDAKLQTLHLFVEGNSLAQMDVDADKQDLTLVPNNARCSIYDSQTGMYYDYVRIDLRGNSSGSFRKKSHGYRFAKCQPLACTNPFDGSEIETRKTSTIAEYCDPAYVRQSLAFWAFREAGAKAPFDYPVRLNLNGAFYQLAFNSERFTDELIEDIYGFDKKGYGYKNSGALHFNGNSLVSTVTCEKKTPDDGNESDLSVLKSWCDTFKGVSATADDQSAITKVVVKSFDLPAWLNYLAEARITMECDDAYANLSTYYDVNGTGTWMPLAYDMNQSWGHIYYGQWAGTKPCYMAEEDRHKAHPFIGGRRVHSYMASGAYTDGGRENYAFEAIWQSTKFRRLYLRHLRTLMDAQLGAPGTAKNDTPVWKYVLAVYDATREAAKLDTAKWRYDSDWTTRWTYPWAGALTHAEGIADLWGHYIVPRRRHLYVTHSEKNGTGTIGYGEGLRAGIPEAQKPLATLAPKLAFEPDAESGVMVIRNDNDEAVDLSAWQLTGSVEWTLPAGLVVDAHDVVYVVADRKQFVADHAADLTDQVIVGNATFNDKKTDLYITPSVFAKTTAAADLPVPDGYWFRGEIPLGGTWSTGATGAVEVACETFAEGPVFTPTNAAVNVVNVDCVLDATLLPEAKNLVALDDAPTGLVVANDGTPGYYLWTKNGWTRLTGGTFAPQAGVAAVVRLELDYRYHRVSAFVREGDAWIALKDAAGETTFRMATAATGLGTIGFMGSGTVSALIGSANATPTYVDRAFYIRIR